MLSWRNVLTCLVLLVLLLAGIWLRLHTLAAPFDRDSYDEGVYWQSLRAMAAGHGLYQSTFYSQPPFFLLAVFPIYTFFGQTLWSARLGIVVLSLCGLPGAVCLGKAFGGRIGAIGALLLLTLNPLYLAESQILQAEAPSTALALLAVGLAYLWWENPTGLPGLLFALLATLTLALGILSKLLALSALVPVGLLALAYIWRIVRQPAANRLVYARSLLIGSAVFILTLALVLLPFIGSLPQLWSMVVTFHTAAKIHFIATQAGNFATLKHFLKSPLAAAALCGTLLALLRRDWRVLPLVAWLLATLYLLWQQVPLFPHHLVALVPPLVALAIAGCSPFSWSRQRSALLLNGASVLTLLLILFVASIDIGAIRQHYAGINAQVASQGTQNDMQVVKDVEGAVAPGQLIVTDAQFLAALANRDTPASLVDTSSVHIQTGYLTTRQVIAEAARPEVHGVLFYTGRISTLPGLRAWVSTHFRLIHDYGGGRGLWIKV